MNNEERANKDMGQKSPKPHQLKIIVLLFAALAVVSARGDSRGFVNVADFVASDGSVDVLDSCIAFWYAPSKGFRHTAIRCETAFSAFVTNMQIGFRGVEAVNTVLEVGKEGGKGSICGLRMDERLVRKDDKAYLGYLRKQL